MPETAYPAMKALIIGGGIGGLCSALCLLAKGWRVKVIEQAPVISEIGAGIQLSPNAIQVMQALGLGDAIKAVAFRPVASQMRDGISGKVIMSSPMGSQMQRRYGAPYLHIHRAKLIHILLDALTAQSPGAMNLNMPVIGYDQDEVSIKAKLANGEEIGGDILIGADGIKSVIANQICGPIKPQYTGNIAWRMTVPLARLGRNIPPPAASVWMGQGKHAVTYLLGDGLANFVGVVESDWPQSDNDEDWCGLGSKEEALADFDGWHPIVTSLIDKSDTHFKWALYDRKPLSRWHDGRAVILGDAAHAMLPFIAQGAAMAIEDSYILAQLLSAHQIRGVESLYSHRIARTSKIQKAANANMRLFHHEDEISRIRKQTSLKIADKVSGNAAGMMALDWIYRHDVTAALQ